ncbi:hypothetical protein Tco_1515792 [Tanacetum coccineum]
MTPRSCLRWKPTGKIFKTVGLRWVPTGKIFTSSTTKVDSEPTNGSNEDITNQYECEQTLDVSAGTLNLSAVMTSDHNSLELRINAHCNEPSSSKLVPKVAPLADKTSTSQQELELLFSHMYEEYFNAGNRSIFNILKKTLISEVRKLHLLSFLDVFKPLSMNNIVFSKLSAINGFDMSLPVAVCSGVVNSLF